MHLQSDYLETHSITPPCQPCAVYFWHWHRTRPFQFHDEGDWPLYHAPVYRTRCDLQGMHHFPVHVHYGCILVLGILFSTILHCYIEPYCCPEHGTILSTDPQSVNVYKSHQITVYLMYIWPRICLTCENPYMYGSGGD